MTFINYILWPPVFSILLICTAIILCIALVFSKSSHKHILYGVLTFLSSSLCILLLHYEFFFFHLEAELKLALVLSIVGSFIAAAVYRNR